MDNVALQIPSVEIIFPADTLCVTYMPIVTPSGPSLQYSKKQLKGERENGILGELQADWDREREQASFACLNFVTSSSRLWKI